MPELRVRSLTKHFSGIVAVRNVDFTLSSGEIVGYLGPNGSGKTTTLRMIAGLVEPSSGRVEWDGRNVRDDLIAFRHELGYVPEEPYLYPFLSGREYLELIGRLRDIPDKLLAMKIDGFLELFGLAGAADQAIASYSKGMRQKIVISAALLHDPAVILFDEPESGLDVTTTLVLRHLIRILAERGRAILYSSHILEVVERVCSRVIVLSKGAIVADDSVAHLQTLMSRTSLEGVFSQLVIKDDPARIAGDLAAVAALGAYAAPMAARSLHATLTRHFLRRFLENDLISPEADRSQLLAVVGAALFSTTLMAALFMSFPYLAAGWTPSGLAIAALNDRHFYIALSMTVSALLAVAQWDSLVVDVRDAAILEPLPVKPATIRRAKLAAVALLGLAAALIVNLMPSLIFPWLVVYTTRVSVFEMLSLIVTHAVVTMAAAAWAYLTVIALRETMAALFTPRWLAFISPVLQGALIVALGSALLLIPPSSGQIAKHGFAGWRAMSPPLWFLGVHEVLAGDVLRHAPASQPLTPRQTRGNAAAGELYDRHRPDFAALARRAGGVSLLTVLLAALAYGWNARRFPSGSPVRSGRRHRWRSAHDLARLAIVRGQTARAGFFFTLAAVWRSNLHRLTIACAGAAAVAAAVVTLTGLDLDDVAEVRTVPTGVLAIQPMFYGALLVAFRHGIRVPAELRANWAFQLAWRDRTRDFMAGVRRAALIGIVVPALLIVLPLFVFFLGPWLAVAHALLGLAGAFVVLEILLFSYAKVPFTCTYAPDENIKALAIPYVVVFLMGASAFARLQHGALQGPAAAVRILALLAAIIAVLRIAARHRSTPGPIEFDETPMTTQQLGLHT